MWHLAGILWSLFFLATVVLIAVQAAIDTLIARRRARRDVAAVRRCARAQGIVR